jgi:hypothetical protein
MGCRPPYRHGILPWRRLFAISNLTNADPEMKHQLVIIHLWRVDEMDRSSASRRKMWGELHFFRRSRNQRTGKGYTVSGLLNGQQRWTHPSTSLLRRRRPRQHWLLSEPLLQHGQTETCPIDVSLTVDRHEIPNGRSPELNDQAALFRAFISQRGNGSLNLAMATSHTNREAVSKSPFLLVN